MAASLTWETLRDLAGFRATKGCAISLYIDLDPSVSPTAGDVESRVNSVVADGEKALDANGPELPREAREGLKADFERIREYFDAEFDRDGAQGFALFCAGLEDVWAPVPLADPVPDEIKVNRSFYLAPLVPFVGRRDGALVAVVGREQGQLYRLSAGRLVELADRTDEAPGQHDQGGWSQARYQRHIENLVSEHLGAVAEELDRQARQRRWPPIVIVCSEEIRPEFMDAISNETANAVAGWTQAQARATPAELYEVALPVLDQWHAQQEAATLERWREEAGRNGRASSGWAETLEAASDGRVELLLFQEGNDRSAWECPACGRVTPTGGPCPLDGEQMEERAEGLDLAVHKTLSQGGTVWAVQHHRDLDPVEGIGALLRY